MRSHLVECRECLTLSWASGDREPQLGMPGHPSSGGRVLSTCGFLLKSTPFGLNTFLQRHLHMQQAALTNVGLGRVGCRVQRGPSWEGGLRVARCSIWLRSVRHKGHRRSWVCTLVLSRGCVSPCSLEWTRQTPILLMMGTLPLPYTWIQTSRAWDFEAETLVLPLFYCIVVS